MAIQDSLAVKMWRDTFLLNISVSWKADVDKTVTDVELWREILANWHYYKNGRKIKKSPAIKTLLDVYESRAREQLEARNRRHNEAEAISGRSREGLSERSNCDMSKVPVQPPSDYFNVGNLVR